MKVNLGNRAALEPGEAINIPIWLRGVGGGKQSLKVLLQYTPRESMSRSSVRYVHFEREVSCRGLCTFVSETARILMFCLKQICILPSLQVFASLAPCAQQYSQFILSMVVTNFRADGNENRTEEILLKDVSIVSSSLVHFHPASLILLYGSCRIDLQYEQDLEN
jgi:hypothetical protein